MPWTGFCWRSALMMSAPLAHLMTGVERVGGTLVVSCEETAIPSGAIVQWEPSTLGCES